MKTPAILSALLLQGCVYFPQTNSVYDPECGVYERHMTLAVEDVGDMGFIGGCNDEGCLALLVAIGAVSATTAVVSGSIVVVGNVVFWLEKKRQCNDW